VPEDEDDTCELELPSPLDLAHQVGVRELWFGVLMGDKVQGLEFQGWRLRVQLEL
jgi:hypothetical protein